MKPPHAAHKPVKWKWDGLIEIRPKCAQVCWGHHTLEYYKKRLAKVWRRRVGSWIFVSRLNRSRDSPPHTQDFHSHTQIKKKKKNEVDVA